MCLTVFSASNYVCRHDNRGAILRLGAPGSRPPPGAKTHAELAPIWYGGVGVPKRSIDPPTRSPSFSDLDLDEASMPLAAAVRSRASASQGRGSSDGLAAPTSSGCGGLPMLRGGGGGGGGCTMAMGRSTSNVRALLCGDSSSSLISDEGSEPSVPSALVRGGASLRAAVVTPPVLLGRSDRSRVGSMDSVSEEASGSDKRGATSYLSAQACGDATSERGDGGDGISESSAPRRLGCMGGPVRLMSTAGTAGSVGNAAAGAGVAAGSAESAVPREASSRSVAGTADEGTEGTGDSVGGSSPRWVVEPAAESTGSAGPGGGSLGAGEGSTSVRSIGSQDGDDDEGNDDDEEAARPQPTNVPHDAPNVVACWYDFPFGALYCESYDATAIRPLRRAQRRTHQFYGLLLANQVPLLAALRDAAGAADAATSEGAAAGTARGCGADEVPFAEVVRVCADFLSLDAHQEAHLRGFLASMLRTTECITAASTSAVSASDDHCADRLTPPPLVAADTPIKYDELHQRYQRISLSSTELNALYEVHRATCPNF